MAKKNPKVDAYIAKSPEYARPILRRLRKIIHKVCPTVVEEIKWSSPFYTYQERVLCATMGFKKHSAVVFWKAPLMIKEGGKRVKEDFQKMRRITSEKELISETKLVSYIKKAMHLNEPTAKLPPRQKRSIAVKVPLDFRKALKDNSQAEKQFQSFTPSKRKDYIFWINGAKTEGTRKNRIESSVKWIAQGKSRNWKYEMKIKKTNS